MLISFKNSKNKIGWYKWFAWYPVYSKDGWLWLETVKRQDFSKEDFKLLLEGYCCAFDIYYPIFRRMGR